MYAAACLLRAVPGSCLSREREKRGAALYSGDELLICERERENNMTDYLAYMVKEIHSCVVATVDDEGLPITTALDLMDSDGASLYFLTPKGRGLYQRLIKQGFISVTAMKGENPMSTVAVSVRGKVRELGSGKIPELFEKNPYMYEVYTLEKASRVLTVFQIYEGTGEWIDLTKGRLERTNFTFGAE